MGEDIEAEVASAFGPLISLLSQHRTDQTDDRITVGEDPHRIGATTDFSVEAFARVVGPDLGLHRGWKAREGKDIGTCGVQMIVSFRQLVVDVV